MKNIHVHYMWKFHPSRQGILNENYGFIIRSIRTKCLDYSKLNEIKY